MFCKSTAIIALLSAPLAAETIGNVQFELPQLGKEWKVGNELNNEKSRTVVYVPQGQEGSEAESFSAHCNILPLGKMDQKAIEKMLEPLFPNQKVAVRILETAPHSVLYEYTLSEGKTEKVHVWNRAFDAAPGTVILQYITEKLSDLSKIAPQVVAVLKEAKVTQKFDWSQMPAEPFNNPPTNGNQIMHFKSLNKSYEKKKIL